MRAKQDKGEKDWGYIEICGACLLNEGQRLAGLTGPGVVSQTLDQEGRFKPVFIPAAVIARGEANFSLLVDEREGGLLVSRHWAQQNGLRCFTQSEIHDRRAEREQGKKERAKRDLWEDIREEATLRLRGVMNATWGSFPADMKEALKKAWVEAKERGKQ